MSSGTLEPRLNRRTVTMDDTKVLKEVVQQSTLRPITSTRTEQMYVPSPQPPPKAQGYAALMAQQAQSPTSPSTPSLQRPRDVRCSLSTPVKAWLMR